MKLPRRFIEEALPLIRWHDLDIPAEKTALRRWMARLGSKQLCRLWQVRRADNLAQNRAKSDRTEEINALEALSRELIAEQPCLEVKDLAVSGKDLISLGMQPGPEIGQTLRRLLQAVLDGEAENDRETLLRLVRENAG